MAETKTNTKKDLITGTGRRKTAVARVFMYPGGGSVLVNDVPIEEYFSDLPYQKDGWKRPFNLLDIKPEEAYDVSIKVHGSGKSAQMDAVVHGVSWALANANPDYAVVMRKNDLLTRDSRMVERKKYWLRKARKAPQYSKR
ncbi:30S ribosomal protein S9 [candidate division WWE3 bacterium]|nr:30S ribosomal protein S9 [candidate division WWE3 bacterium]